MMGTIICALIAVGCIGFVIYRIVKGEFYFKNDLPFFFIIAFCIFLGIVFYHDYKEGALSYLIDDYGFTEE